MRDNVVVARKWQLGVHVTVHLLAGAPTTPQKLLAPFALLEARAVCLLHGFIHCAGNPSRRVPYVLRVVRESADELEP